MSLHKEPFQVNIPPADLRGLRDAILASRLPPPFYEGEHDRFGITSKWMREARDCWVEGYEDDWRAFERRINTFPQFISEVPFEDGTFKIHYIQLRATKSDIRAIPLLLLHGWPGECGFVISSYIREFMLRLSRRQLRRVPRRLPRSC